MHKHHTIVETAVQAIRGCFESLYDEPVTDTGLQLWDKLMKAVTQAVEAAVDKAAASQPKTDSAEAQELKIQLQGGSSTGKRVFIPKSSALLVEDIFTSLLKHYTCGSLLTILAGLQEESGNKDSAHALVRILDNRRGVAYVEGEPGNACGEAPLFGAEGWVVEDHQKVSTVEVTQVRETSQPSQQTDKDE